MDDLRWRWPTKGSGAHAVVVQRLDRSWRARYVIGDQDGTLAIREVGLFAVGDHPRALSGDATNRMAPARVLAFARSGPSASRAVGASSGLVEGWETGERPQGPMVMVEVEGWGIDGLERPERRPTGRPARALADDAQLAAIYLDEVRERGKRGAVIRTAAALDHDVDWTRKRLDTLRRSTPRRGPLLTRTGKGRAGGELTELARLALAQAAPFIEEPTMSNPFFRAAENGQWRAREGRVDAVSG